MSRFSPRRLIATTAAVALVCFCSCERHHPDELHSETLQETTSQHVGQHQDGEHLKADKGAPAAADMSPLPSSTPVEFFPSPTP